MTRYIPRDGWVEGINLPGFSNRYLYCTPTSVYVMAGDRPLLRLAEKRRLLGTLQLLCAEKALQDCADVHMRYRPGMAEWIIRDPAFDGEIKVTAVTAGRITGMAVKVESPVEIRFTYGGLSYYSPDGAKEGGDFWNLNVKYGDAPLTAVVFDEAWLEDNTAVWDDAHKSLILSAPTAKRQVYVCSDAPLSTDGVMVSGTFGTYFAATLSPVADAQTAFDAGAAWADTQRDMFCVTTPDPYIDAACAVAAGEMHGAWDGTKTRHGNMSWSSPLLGWLAHCGQTAMGCRDRALATLKAYAAAQVRESDNTGYGMDETGTMPAENSRFYGRGYVAEDQGFYNMQTQFFHQMILGWRFSGDPEFAAILRDALRLHIEWQDACFDPDNTGLYISSINTWPTDSVSFSDAGAVEETCYAYAARRVMAELTEGEESERYAAKAEQIKKAFFDKLWLTDWGYPALYRDRSGFVHDNPWLYASFLPVECGLLDAFQTAQALYFPLWHMDRSEDGGFWFSDWTPGIWSVRENAGGENMQQAGAFLKGGEPDEAVRLIGSASRSYLNTEIPGDMMHPTIETSSLYLKTIVEGLFGYRPDYPHGRVTIAPMLPYAWEQASLRTGDVCIDWTRHGVKLHLERAADVTLRLRLYAEKLLGIDGADNWTLEPGVGGMAVVISLGVVTDAVVMLRIEGERDFLSAEEYTSLPSGADVYNPQGIRDDSWGEHMAFRRMADGSFRKILVHMGENPAEAENRRRQTAAIPAGAQYTTVEAGASFNADVAHIFQNRYLSPRPQRGCTAQIGYDGFSYWTFPKWSFGAPEMKLEQTGVQYSADGVPFAIAQGEKNIAFASLWDNFPDEVTIPVGKAADMAVVLVCGSTSPMLCGVENAKLTFAYTDGTRDELPLVNPKNYISLCAYPERASAGHIMIKRNDVFNPIDGDLMKDFTPEIVQLGENIRAMAIRWTLPEDRTLERVSLRASTRDVVVGLMGVTMVNGTQE